MQITTIGLDIAKNVFQVPPALMRPRMSSSGSNFAAVSCRILKSAPCLIGMEACATAHHWARALTQLGHQVRLMPAKDVKAYVKRNKNDAADAEAICEAVRSTVEVGRATGPVDAASGTRSADAPTHPVD